MILPWIGMLLNLVYQQFAWLLSYIANNNVFPMPLTEGEEQALILRMEAGDPGSQKYIDRTESTFSGPYR